MALAKRFLPVILLFLFGSCFDQNDCLITSTNLVKIDLKTLAGVARTASFISVQQDSLGPNRDHSRHFALYEKKSTPIGSVVLPLDPSASQTYYKFVTTDSVERHLSLTYTTYSRVISTECGAFLYYENLKVVPQYPESSFDSTYVTSHQLLKSVATNIELFF